MSWIGSGIKLLFLPHLVLALTVEPLKSRLCHDARYLNFWMRDNPFFLDTLNSLPRYVTKDSFQTVLDDKSGYDHIFLTQSTRLFFGIQWRGWFFTYNTLPYGWKIFPFIYHTTGLLATSFFAQSVFHVSFTLMIATMVSFKSLWIKENKVPWPQRMNTIAQLVSLKFFWLPIIC